MRPNVRTYTALVTALGNGGQWQRALDMLAAMRREGPGGHVEPNAYTFSALLKARVCCTLRFSARMDAAVYFIFLEAWRY